MIHSKMSLVDEIYEYLKEYFQMQQALPDWKISPDRLTGDLLKVFTNQRKLTPRNFENELRERLLSDHLIYDLIKSFSEQTFNLALPLVCIQRLHQSGSPLLSKYVSIVVSQLISLLSGPVRTDETEQFHQILAARRFLEKNIPEILEKLEKQLHPDYLLNLILANGTIFKLLRAIQSFSQSVAYKLIEGLNQERVDELISKTIAQERSIGTLSLILRELRRNNPELLEQLEKRLGAPSLLKLIRANGTIFELFWLIQDSSPTMAISLVEGLEQESVDELISKTIAQKRSIGTLNLTFRALKQKQAILLRVFEEKLGSSALWKLILGCGTLKELSFFLDDMSLEFGQIMVTEAEEYPLSLWEQLILQGSYWDLVYFLEHALSHFVNSPARNCLFQAMEFALPQVLLKSNWYEINSGAKNLYNLELTDFKELALQSQKNFLDEIDVSELKFESFNEAMNALQCLFREREELRNGISSQLWQILPDCQVWEQQEHYWANIRMLICLHRETELKGESIQLLLEKLRPTLDLKKADSIQTALVLWELYAIQQEQQISNFSPILNYLEELTEQAIRLFKTKNVQKVGQQERLKLLSLFGILTLRGQPVEKIATKTFREQVSIGTDKLKRQLLNYPSFLLAYFGLHGLQMLLPQRHIFTPLVSKDLAILLEQYPEIDPVLQSLLVPPCIQAGRRLLELNINMIDDLKLGMKLWGQVTRTQVYGIFIDLGVKKNGLLHKSQLSHYDSISLKTTFPQGSWVEVEILKVDLKKGRIELRLSKTN